MSVSPKDEIERMEYTVNEVRPRTEDGLAKKGVYVVVKEGGKRNTERVNVSNRFSILNQRDKGSDKR